MAPAGPRLSASRTSTRSGPTCGRSACASGWPNWRQWPTTLPADAAMSSLACGSLAVPDSWDFGAGPYGHERLVLPARQLSHDRAGSVPALSFRSLAAARRQILAHGAVTGPHPDGPDGPLSAQARLFSFRWMIGHQTAFILWQLLARDLAAATSDDGMAAAVASRLGCFIDGYSAMLLYCGSCPRQVYHDVIRVSM